MRTSVPNHGRKNGAGNLIVLPKLIIFLSYGIIILRIASRGTYIYFRTEVGIRRRRKVCGIRTYGDAFGVSSRKTGGSRIFVARCKHGDAAIYYSVRRACIVDEVVQNFFFQRISIGPFFFCGGSGSVSFHLIRFGRVVTPTALQKALIARNGYRRTDRSEINPLLEPEKADAYPFHNCVATNFR